MRRLAKTFTLAAAVLLPGCFTGADTAGLPCLDSDQCGKGLSCDRGFCGGPTLPVEPWGPCLVEGCALGEVCGAFGGQFLSCGPGCASDTECTAFLWEGWQLTCGGQQVGDTTKGICLPLCDANLLCPKGRDCVTFGNKNVCAWWQISM